MKLKKISPKLILILVLITLIIIFSIQNSNIVQLKVFFWKVNIPGVLLIMLSVSVGIIMGLIFPSKKQ
jgi:uncharacterized integral membrane protein